MATRPLLLNPFEIRTDAALREAAGRTGYRICPKVRVADVLKIERSGIPAPDFRYALRAHFDFLVMSGERGEPQFAVEFDGPRHDWDMDTILRDRMKESLCDRLDLPLLRIDAGYLNRVTARYTVVGWFVEFWKLQDAFYAAQERGEIPEDEPFCYFSFFEPSDNPWGGVFGESFALDGEARRTFAHAYRSGFSRTWMPEELCRDLWGVGEDGYAPAYALFPLAEGGVIAGFARCRGFTFGFDGLTAGLLAGDLAVADAGKNYLAYLDGDYEPLDEAAIVRLRKKTAGWISQGFPIDQTPPRIF